MNNRSKIFRDMRCVEVMGYIYIYTSQPPQETLFFTPPPFEILVLYPNFLGFCLGLV